MKNPVRDLLSIEILVVPTVINKLLFVVVVLAHLSAGMDGP